MATMPVTFEAVRKIALALEDVQESTSYGTAAFKVRGGLFLRLKEDGDSLVVRADFEQRDALIAEDPGTYYVTDHYLKYEWVLVRLSRVHPDAMRDLIRMAWRSAASAAMTKRRASRPRRAPRQ
jgi:hypothetical protein